MSVGRRRTAVRKAGWRTMLAIAVAASALVAPAGPVGAAEYTMVTQASYVVDDAAGVIQVTVDITFTNTFAPPAGQISRFPTIRIAIHDHAAAVSARDGNGPLKVAVAPSAGVNVATITFRSQVTYPKSATIQLAYQLQDGADPAIRVGPHLISFPAWGFGTQSAVRVELPASFDVRVDGSQLDASVEGDTAILTSGTIADPTRWLSQVGATREADYVTIQQAVPLEGGTADLQVRHWVDDPEWGASTVDLVVAALPRLETAFGVPYPGQGPLVITESVTAGGPDDVADSGGVAVGFTEPAFTVLHQLAHTWAGEGMIGDRWILEGLASWAAATVSTEMEIDLPHDPVAVAASLQANAFPLADWDGSDRAAEAEAWAYAAAWSLAKQAADLVGPEAFRQAIQRMAAGFDAYEPAADGFAATDLADAPAAPAEVTSRAFLDHLDAVTEAAVVEALAGPVLGAGAGDELTARAAARAAYEGLLVAAGDWGAPDPVRSALAAWQFEEAQRAIAEAEEWLVGRDALIADLASVGLTPPERLGAAYRVHGGGTGAWAEIDAERAVAEAHADAVDAVEGGLDPVARVGLLMGPGPEDRLATAATAFSAGDLRAAADELAGLNQDLATATAGGLVRMLGAVVAVGAGILLGTVALRRRQTRTDYTPEP